MESHASDESERLRVVSIGDALRDAQDGFRHMLRSEINLATTEMKIGAVGFTRRSKFLVIFAALAVWGILPFTAFLIVGLGVLLDGNYWLSALILTVLAVGIGGLGIKSHLRKVKDEGLAMRRTRRTIGRKLRRVV
jgi:hypothetical protein